MSHVAFTPVLGKSLTRACVGRVSENTPKRDMRHGEVARG